MKTRAISDGVFPVEMQIVWVETGSLQGETPSAIKSSDESLNEC